MVTALLQSWERVQYQSASGRFVDFLRVNVLFEAKSNGNGKGIKGLVTREWIVRPPLADKVQQQLVSLSPLSAVEADIDIDESSYKGVPRVTRYVLEFRIAA